MPAWVWLPAAAGFALLFLVCWRCRDRTAQFFAGAAVWLLVLASPGSREAASDQKLLFHLTGALRYYYAAEYFFFLALMISSRPGATLPKPLRVLARLWLGAALLMCSFNFARAPLDWPMFFFGPPWKPQVEQWRMDPSKPLALWPNGWQLTLPPKP